MEVQNLSLLFAITAPVAAVAALHVWLALNGERGSLLLPHLGAIESTSSPACVLGAIVKADARVRAEEAARTAEAANDESAREAA
ncbi:hypothetical protein BWI17_04665 [Betaproteobacteria bacterium GR16-43]|nr:hypothetical protein BWI17_04665 [Betaproteobacteria bacterium GR16-43]